MRQVFVFLSFLLAHAVSAQDAVTLTECTLFYSPQDSDSLPSRIIPAGFGLTVTGISSEVHTLDHEGRMFHWFHVEGQQGQEGWVRGFEVATAYAASKLPEHLAQYKELELPYHRDFGKSKLWFAAICTIDPNRDDGTSFIEYYLVLGNAGGKQLYHQLESSNAQGNTRTHELYIKDVNQDTRPDFVIVKQSTPTFGTPVWQLEVLTVQHGRWVQLLDIPLTILDIAGDIAPTLARKVEFDKGLVRIESIEYDHCTDSLVNTDNCLSLRVETLKWSQSQQQYQALYAVAYSSIDARVLNQVSLYKSPDANSAVIGTAFSSQRLKVKKAKTQYISTNGIKTRKSWYLVENEQNQTAYVEGKDLDWKQYAHRELLERWHSGTPLTVYEFTPESEFVRIEN
jgi:hypothetical protein